MMQFRPFEPGIEVWGACVEPFIEAFKLFPDVVLRKIVTHGIGTMRGQDIVIDRTAWYPQEEWLKVYEDIAKTIGRSATFQIGQFIPQHAVFPPSVSDIRTAIASVDIAYHMNHRKNGRVMFDPATGTKLSGIGSYGYKPVEGQRKIVSVCHNPYPCDFDRGILSAMATRFERNAWVSHDDRAPCRKNGAESCTYTITW